MNKFNTWVQTLTPKQRKNIKTGIDVFILLMFVTTVFTVYNIGEENGAIKLCKDQSGVLVEYQGLRECWPQSQYDEYIKQWDNDAKMEEYLQNELQYNFS